MKDPNLLDAVYKKAILKKNILEKTKETFELFKRIAIEISEELKTKLPKEGDNISFGFASKNNMEFQLQFADDILLFMQHSNVFEFSRNHEIMKLPYIRENADRSFCGCIHIYNFLTDSFIYNRDKDLGYLIGRVFINAEGHYFIEGKRELGFIYNNFGTAIIDEDAIRTILESAVLYTVNFDLLIPPYDDIKIVSVADVLSDINVFSGKTGKRLGFKFQADKDIT